MDAERALRDHIATVTSYYRGKLTSWDVVNEPIPEFPKRPTDRRDSLWQGYLGNGYMRMAFRTAADADPDVQLVLNDYDIELVGERFAARRAALRNIVSDLLDTGTPLHAVGLQSHLHGELEIDTDGLAKCVADFRSWGLDVIVTELDVDDFEASRCGSGAGCDRRETRPRRSFHDLVGGPAQIDCYLGAFGSV